MFRTVRRLLTYLCYICIPLLVLLSASGAFIFNATPALAASKTTSDSCEEVKVPVAIDSSRPYDLSQYIYGWLCSPAQGPSSTIQLLNHGATYGHEYWDFPYQSQTYSYVDAMARANLSTFNYDRIGVGLSSHPPSTEITLASDAFVAHQLVQDLLAGKIGQHKFARVVIVGHSVGSLITAIEAATYHDVAGVILSGQVQLDSPSADETVNNTFYQAKKDPRFQRLNLDSGYLTTLPGTRTQDFYSIQESDPQVRRVDENTKETTSLSEFLSDDGFFEDISKQIDVPVLDVVGQRDTMACLPTGAEDCTSSATLQQAEAPFYSPAAHLRAIVIPNTGHSLNLHFTASQWFDDVTDWMHQSFGA
jgi:pimeloyl-ACP methyl ester carboxylesterase